MSTQKRKGAPCSSSLEETFKDVSEILTRVKLELADLSQRNADSTLLEDLQHLAALGETLCDQRKRYKTNAGIADALDREGVHLWNIARLAMNGSGSNEDRCLFAALRLAGFRLIEAGIEQKPGIESLVNLLQLASKTGVALSECGRNNVAASVLGRAAKFEEKLRNSKHAGNSTLDQTVAQAVIFYFGSRMLVAWRDGNDAIAQFMLEKITEGDTKRLSLITLPDRELLASRMTEIGKSMLKTSARLAEDNTINLTDAKKALDSIKWFQKAFMLLEKMEESASPSLAELKQGTLRSLARAFYLSSSIEAENLTRAETTLQELINSIDNSNTKNDSGYQQLRWMRLAVLKKQKAPENVIQEAFESIVDHIPFTEVEVTDILQELRTFVKCHTLVSGVLHRCLARLLSGPPECACLVQRLLLSLLAHCAKDQDHPRAINEAQTACSLISEQEYELEKAPAMACLTILWKIGDRHYQNKKWSQAAEWFLVGTHKAFASIADMSSPKCLRKAALCYIEHKEYARASQVIRRCPSGQSSTSYLQFLTAVYQGMEGDATAAICSILEAPDFDRKMLLLATQLAHEVNLKNTLLVSLEALLKTAQTHGPMDTDIEAVCLVRCIIRLVIRLMKETANEKDRMLLVKNLIRHFTTAVSLVEAIVSGKNAPFITKDVSWLWRTAFNVAVQGCSEWQYAEDQISDLFELAYKLAHAYTQLSVVNTDAELYIHMAQSMFSCISARMFALRHPDRDYDDKLRRQESILQDIENAKQIFSIVRNQLKDDPTELDKLNELLRSIQLFEAELCTQRQEWNKMLSVINEVEGCSATLSSFEAIADMLWSANDCPVHVLFVALESLLHACLDRGNLSIEKFSRWLRTICTILLSRNSQADRLKAINYVEQALTVLEEQNGEQASTPSEQVYPIDERHWLLSTSYNTGVECLAVSSLDEAKRWFEISTVICRFVPDGARHSEKISETYRRLLDQYTSRQVPPDN